MKTYKTPAAAKTQATTKTKRTGVEHIAFEHAGEWMVGTNVEATEFVAALEAAKKVEAPAKKSSGWIKSAIEHIKSVVGDLNGKAINTIAEGKKLWVLVDGKEVFWVYKADRAQQLVAKLQAA